MAGGLAAGVDWESLGHDAAGSIDAAHAVLVVGQDPVATARAAVGLGRAQSRSRRVAIGDLIGDVEPLQRLVPGDDPHGIADSFLYGVSLNKIARQVDESGMLFVMPSGTEPMITADIMAHERWRRLAAGFREVGALLVLVAPVDGDGVPELAAMMDGVVVVGDPSSVLMIPRHTVLAHIDAPLPPAVPVAPAPADAPAGIAERRPPSLTPPPLMLPKHDTDEQRPITPNIPRERRKAPLFAALAAAAVVAIGGTWYAMGRPGLSSAPGTTDAEATGAPPSTDLRVIGVEPDSAPEPTPPAVELPSTLVAVANPRDSLDAAPFGVVIVATNDEATALARWADLGLSLPAGTVTMVRVRGERGRFFQMQAGAYPRARQADSLLAALRKSGKLQPDWGRVVSTPYALALELKISKQAAQNVADGYGQRQIAAYPMLQGDGTATIYVGAFESPDDAVPLMAELLAKGVNTKLHYRTGRSF